MVKKRDISHRQIFEEQGETWVRHLLHSTSDQDTKAQASAWLAEKQAELDLETFSKRDAREEKTLALASRANRIAWIAVIIAAISSVKEIKWIINSAISLLK
jgi:hypothetical protein